MIRLVGQPVPLTSKQAVDALEGILARAKSGEIVQVAIAYVTEEGTVGHIFAAKAHVQLAALLGSATRMSLEIARYIDETA